MREIKTLPWSENTACILPERWQLRWQDAIWHCVLLLGQHTVFYLVSPNLTGEGDWVKGGWSGFAHPPVAAQCWGCWAHLDVSQLCNLLSWLLQLFLLQLPLSSIWFILVLYSILHCFLLVPGWISQGPAMHPEGGLKEGGCRNRQCW